MRALKLPGTKSLVTVRPIEERDVDVAMRYWETCNPEDFTRMGVDPVKVKSLLSRQGLTENIRKGPVASNSQGLIWEVEGKAVGHCSLSNIKVGDRAEIHLHLWDRVNRFKGVGRRAFTLCLLYGFENFKLKKILCEPAEQNPFPNAMLKKLGFPLAEKDTLIPSPICALTTVNRYVITPELAEKAYADLSTDES